MLDILSELTGFASWLKTVTTASITTRLRVTAIQASIKFPDNCYLHVHFIYLRPMPDFTEGGGQDHTLLARLSALEARTAAQPKDPAQGDAIPRDGMSMIFMINFCV